MESIDAFLNVYGLAAIFLLMLVKAAGVPIPVPADVIMLAAAARAAEGKLSLWQAFLAILLALVLGGLIQFALARRLGRGVIYRSGRYVGLTPARLDAAAGTVRHGGPLGIGLAILTPGVRAVAVVACGLAALPLRVFVPGLVLGSTLFLSLHFALGFLGGSIIARLAGAVPWPWLALLVLLAAGVAAWALIRRRQRPMASRGDIVAEALGAWHEATCPACLALGTVSRVPPPRQSTVAAPGAPVRR
jgi:membrane protein DedA with SNARE-associated domain